MRSDAKVIAVSEMTNSAGLITWWRLAGKVSLQTLQEKWNEDQTLLPRAVSDQLALHRAMRTLYENQAKGRFVEKLRNTTGYAIVHAEAGDDINTGEPPDPVFLTEIKAWLKDGELRCVPPSLRKDIWDAWQVAAGTLEPSDISTWLIRQAERLQSVRLREGGGIYFVPETRVKAWRTIATLVEESCYGSSVYEVPAVRTEKAVEAILSALSAEAMREVDTIVAEIEQGGVGKRGTITRQDACRSILLKLSHYEELLGARLTDVRSAVEALEGRLVEALMVAE